MFKTSKYLIIMAVAVATLGCTTSDAGTVRSCDAPVAKYVKLCGSTASEQNFVRNSCTTSMSDDSYECWIACVNSSTDCFGAQHCCPH